MGTPALIAVEQSYGEFRAIHCHSDGYLSWVGLKLHRRYQDPEKVRRLLALGRLSSLGNDPDEPMDYRELTRRWRQAEIPAIMKWPEEKCITLRPNGVDEPFQTAAGDFEELVRTAELKGVRNLYVWGEGGWMTCGPPDWEPAGLEQELRREGLIE